MIIIAVVSISVVGSIAIIMTCIIRRRRLRGTMRKGAAQSGEKIIGPDDDKRSEFWSPDLEDAKSIKSMALTSDIYNNFTSPFQSFRNSQVPVPARPPVAFTSNTRVSDASWRPLGSPSAQKALEGAAAPTRPTGPRVTSQASDLSLGDVERMLEHTRVYLSSFPSRNSGADSPVPPPPGSGPSRRFKGERLRIPDSSSGNLVVSRSPDAPRSVTLSAGLGPFADIPEAADADRSRDRVSAGSFVSRALPSSIGLPSGRASTFRMDAGGDTVVYPQTSRPPSTRRTFDPSSIVGKF